MSESKSPIEIETLKEGSSVSIDIPAALYSRIRDLLMVGIPFDDLETAIKVLETIKTSDKDPDPATYHTRTLLYLISRIEEAARKEGKLETKKVDRTTGKVV